MMLFDTHCHLTLIKSNKDNIEAIIKNAVKNRITSILDISAGLSDFFTRRIILHEVSCKYSCALYLSTGIPPYFSDKRVQRDIDEVKNQAESEKKVIGIGEIGLDYYHNYGKKKQQISLFIEQIDLANQLNLPVIIHTRDADSDLVDTLKHHKPLKDGIVHCFSSGVRTARALLDLGMYLSFAGNITYKKSDHMRDAARFVPRDRYVIETDSPYLPPEGHRGKPNEPANIIHTARYIAELRGISFEFLAEQTTRNARTLLSL